MTILPMAIRWDGGIWIAVFTMTGIRIALTSIWFICPGCAGIHLLC